MKQSGKIHLAALFSQVANFYKNAKQKPGPSYIGIHGLDHVKRVRRNAQLILDELTEAQKAQTSAKVIQAAAILHDLGYGQLTKPSGTHQEHIDLSVALCADLLQQTGFTKDEISGVQSLILSHHDKDHTCKSLEQKILYVADKVDMIGFDGTVRMFMKHALSSELDRDKIAQYLLENLKARVHDDLLHVGVGHRIVQSRWEETEHLLREILVRGAEEFRFE
jgi:HD superfamily phosphodiesterase